MAQLTIHKYKIATSFIDKWLGFQLVLKYKKPLIFKYDKEDIYPLHTCFMFFPLDIIWVDKDNIITDVKYDVKPWKTYVEPKNKSVCFIEFKSGIIPRMKIGDQIILSK